MNSQEWHKLENFMHMDFCNDCEYLKEDIHYNCKGCLEARKRIEEFITKL